MATEEQLFGALRQADAAGDTAAATRFAQMIQEQRKQAPPADDYQATPGFHQAGPTVGGVTIELPGQAAPEAPQHTPGYDKALSQMMVREANINHGMGGGKGPLDALNTGTSLSFADEIMGGLEGARVMGKNLFGQNPGYSPREAYDAARDAYNMDRGRFHEEHPIADIGLQVAGGLASPGVGAAGKFIGAAPGVAAAMGRSALVGAGYGGVAGAGAADGDLVDRAAGAAKGGAAGAAFGAAAPYAARVLGSAVNAGARALQPNVVPGASRRAGQILADVIDPAAAKQLEQLGPEAMLVDAGPSAVGVAQGVATRPGAGRDALVAALKARNQGANARLDTDVVEALGPNVVPSEVEATLQGARKALGPKYREALAGAGEVDLLGAANVLDTEGANAKGAIATALRRVRGMMQTKVPGLEGVAQLDSTADQALAIRQALDDMIGGAQGNERRILTMVRKEVADALGEAAPGIRDVDDDFALLMRQSEALETGQQLLDSGRTAVRPAELAKMMADNAPQTNDALRAGTRAEIDRLTGTKANDLVALRNAVKGEGDWNRSRLAQVFGEEEAAKVVNAVDREAAFADAYHRLVQNSETASREGGAKFLAERTTKVPRDTPQTLMGAGAEAARKLADAVLGGRNRAAADALSNELGPILTAKGDAREDLVRQLLAGNSRNAKVRLTADQSRQLSQRLLEGAGRVGSAGVGGGQSTGRAESRAR